jgi:hypothetical protein
MKQWLCNLIIDASQIKSNSDLEIEYCVSEIWEDKILQGRTKLKMIELYP